MTELEQAALQYDQALAALSAAEATTTAAHDEARRRVEDRIACEKAVRRAECILRLVAQGKTIAFATATWKSSKEGFEIERAAHAD